MSKHKVKVHMWGTAPFKELRTYGSVMYLDVRYGALAYDRNSPVLEMNWNMLEQHPEEMGFACPSYRIPNGTRLNPVDAYSADGDLFPLDQRRQALLPFYGIHQSGEQTLIGVGVGEHYRLEKNGKQAVFFCNNAASAVNDKNCWCGYLMYHADDSLVTAELYSLFVQGGVVYISSSQPNYWNISPSSWAGVWSDGSTAADWINQHGGPQWSSTTTTTSTQVTCVTDVEPVPHGYFDDLISQANQAEWAQLARDAYNNIEAGFDGNGIALASDLTHTVSSARDTIKSIGGLAGKRKANALASVYLSFRYGWKLLMSDVTSLSQAMKRNVASRFTRCTAMSSHTVNGVTTQCTYQVYYDKYGGILKEMSSLDQMTQELDLEMSLGNLWDMVKYSFVLDWFADVGSVLESVDSFYNVAYRYDVVAAGKSLKVSRSNTPVGYTGSFTETAYRRRYEKDAIPPSPLPATHQPRSQSWIDGAALVVQRL